MLENWDLSLVVRSLEFGVCLEFEICDLVLVLELGFEPCRLAFEIWSVQAPGTSKWEPGPGIKNLEVCP